MLALELLQGDGERVLAVVLQIDQWIQEIAPLEEELKEGGGGDSGLGERQDDARIDAEFAASVNARGGKMRDSCLNDVDSIHTKGNRHTADNASSSAMLAIRLLRLVAMIIDPPL